MFLGLSPLLHSFFSVEEGSVSRVSKVLHGTPQLPFGVLVNEQATTFANFKFLPPCRAHCTGSLEDFVASEDHLAIREHFLASVPLYVSVCGFSIVIAPPVAGVGTSFGMETYLLEGSFLLSAVFCFVVCSCASD